MITYTLRRNDSDILLSADHPELLTFRAGFYDCLSLMLTGAELAAVVEGEHVRTGVCDGGILFDDISIVLDGDDFPIGAQNIAGAIQHLHNAVMRLNPRVVRHGSEDVLALVSPHLPPEEHVVEYGGEGDCFALGGKTGTLAERISAQLGTERVPARQPFFSYCGTGEGYGRAAQRFLSTLNNAYTVLFVLAAKAQALKAADVSFSHG